LILTHAVMRAAVAESLEIFTITGDQRLPAVHGISHRLEGRAFSRPTR